MRIGFGIMILLCVQSWPAEKMRVVLNPVTLSGWMRAVGNDSAERRVIGDRRNQLAYYASLGYSHVVYYPDWSLLDGFVKVKGEWVYRADRLSGRPDSSFRAMKAEVEQAGMRMIPMVPSLSHMASFITWVDSSISEFPDWAAFDSFAVAKGIPGNRDLNHVASPVDNPAADQIFRELLKMIRFNWGSTPLGGNLPSYVLIGHDELGHDSVCFIKAGRTSGRPESPSRLVAMEIRRRAAQIDSVLGPSVEILLFGDSFLPTDLGERYGLAGSKGSGKGGVLSILATFPGMRRKVILIPWNYIVAEGQPHYWSKLRYSRGRQLAYLDTLGYRYILGTGEHGSSGMKGHQPFSPPFALGDPEPAYRSIFEWVKASQSHPRRLAGYMHMTFERFDLCSPQQVCAGFTAPLLAYLAWTPYSPYASQAFSLKRRSYRSRMFDGIDPIRSRRDLAWVRGVHYPDLAPPATTSKEPVPSK